MENNNIKKSDAALREEKVLEFWRANKIFEKSLEQTKNGEEFVFYDGPVTANSKPVLHTMVPFSFKDAIPRYKTMQGFHVRRKGGWDTHGLPVELQVEKKLGLNSKKGIEEYGIAKFNKECRDSVWEYVGFWKDFTARMGYWADQDNAYVTYHNEYIESVWNVVKQVDKQKLLYKDYKVVPWCTRCGTALSSHELAQGYEEVKDLSVYAKFKIVGVENGYFLAWTTTPWTLPGNVALAVGKDIIYVEAKVTKENSSEILVLAKDRLAILPEGYEIIAEHKGSEMVGMAYEPLFAYLSELMPATEKPKLDKAFKIYTADFVNTTDGTGIVHTAVMYGQDDFELGTKVGLPKFHLVNPEGKFIKGTGQFEGRYVREMNQDGKPTLAVNVIEDLKKRNLFFKQENYKHQYPHCWRCHTALIYYARDSWYIKMSDPKVKAKLIKENKDINWEPAYTRDGRFGEWLREIKDWAISRERYWGTPLPVWACDKCHKYHVVGSLDELKEKSNKLPLNEKKELDLHRPYIDEVTFSCECGGNMKRAKEVMDVWLDSGCMPFAQDHYPFSAKKINYPADFISEAIDQTRGWFYTLHAVGILMGKGKAYKNVICLGHLLDATGKKMSKSIGNIVDPWEAMDKFGVDTLRLWMYSVNQPGESKNFDEKTVALLSQQTFGLLYNVLAFYELYRDPQSEVLDCKEPDNILDVWIIAKMNNLIEYETKHLDVYKLLEPVREIRDFINDLSTWYLRRSRERIKGTLGLSSLNDTDKAKLTLYYVLKNLAKLMAPLAPFAAEDIWQRLKNNKDPESVHLAEWPKAGDFNQNVISNMVVARTIVSMGLEARQKEKLQIRQPLSEIVIEYSESSLDYQTFFPPELLEIIKEEINIRKISFRKIKGSIPFILTKLDTKITPELKQEGNYRELLRAVQEMRKRMSLTPNEIITIAMETNEEGRKLVEKFREEIKKVVSAKEIKFELTEGDVIKIGELEFKVKVIK